MEEISPLEDPAIRKEVDGEGPSLGGGRVVLLWGLGIGGRAGPSSFQEDHEEGRTEVVHGHGTHPERPLAVH